MNGEHQELYQRIEAYSLDDPTALYSFLARLATENDWSAEYARRVVEEYKKFAFLAVTAGHPVCPSDAVDQAWHLHLTYTHAYWDHFCAEVLGTRLHHHPTTGGPVEKEKFTEQYARTLESYRAAFGRSPPSDIWPAAAARFADGPVHRRINSEKNWIVPKMWVTVPLLVAFVMLVQVGLYTGATALERSARRWASTAQSLTPDEKETLLVFFAGLVVAGVVAATLRRLYQGPSGEPEPEALELDPYETAYLTGGKGAVLPAAVAALVSRQLLRVDTTGKKLERDPAGRSLVESHPVERAVWEAVDPEEGSGPEDLESRFALPPAPAERLAALDLIVPTSVAAVGRAVLLVVALLVPLLGALWMLGRLACGEPSGLLILPCVISACVAVAAFGEPLHRTRRGDRTLTELKTRHAALGAVVRDGTAPRSGDDLARAVALFGVAVLAGGPWALLYALLKPYVEERGGFAWVEDGAGCGGGCGGCD